MKTTAKGKQRSGNNRGTKQSKQPTNVNSSEAKSTRNSNENAKMQENHSRNQNRKAAEVLLPWVPEVFSRVRRGASRGSLFKT